MSAKWTDCLNANTTSRLEYDGACALHLSDGSLVCLDYDATVDRLLLRYSSDHNTLNAIATVLFDVAAGIAAGLFYGLVTLCRDASDNLYVIGTDHVNTGHYRVFAYTKGAGYTWSAATTLVGAGAGAFYPYSGNAAVWCNTGGGTGSHGHIMLVSTSGGHNCYAILDAGAALAGAGTLVTASGVDPTFLGGASTSNPNGVLDISSDGFGAASGIAAVIFDATHAAVGAWAVSSVGALSTNTNITTTLATGSAAKQRLVRVSSNLWVLAYGSSSSGTHWMIARFSATAQLTAGVDSGAPTNMPLRGGTTWQWDAALDPSVADRVWVLAMAVGGTTMWGVHADVTSGVTWASAATSIDTGVTAGNTAQDVRAVKEPVGTKVDFQVDSITSGSSPALFGDWTTFGLRTGIYIGAVLIG